LHEDLLRWICYSLYPARITEKILEKSSRVPSLTRQNIWQ
jgi:hypothetical protein